MATYVVPIDSIRPSIISVEPSLAEGQSAKGLVDMCDELLSAGETQWHMADIEVLHEVRTLQTPYYKHTNACLTHIHDILTHLSLLQDIAPASAAEGLDSIELALLHAGAVVVTHDGHRLA